MTNDQLLDQLHRFVGETLNFHPTVEIVPGLRGGLFDDAADGAASFSAKGAPVIALSPDYVRWPQEHLRYVFLHECAHHRLKHVHPAARASAQHITAHPRTQENTDYTRHIEKQADDVAKSYIKIFETWSERAQIRQIQEDIKFIKWALRQRGLVK